VSRTHALERGGEEVREARALLKKNKKKRAHLNGHRETGKKMFFGLFLPGLMAFWYKVLRRRIVK